MDTKQVTKKKNSKGIVIGIIIAFVVVLALILVILISVVLVIASPKRRVNQQLNMGDKYITELDFDNAIIAYQKAIEIDPNSAEAYIGLANAYVSNGNYESAIAVLKEGYGLTNSDDIKMMLSELIEYVEQNEIHSDNANFEELNDDNAQEVYGDVFDTVSAGDFVCFGLYEQDDNTSNGPEPIEWQVLFVGDEKILLITSNVLTELPYNNEWVDITWEECSLREWLNSDFYNTSFNLTEKSMIQESYLINDDNKRWGTPGGNNTTDRVFCLSYDEYYSFYEPCYCDGKDWWLRTPGNQADWATMLVNDGSSVYTSTYPVDNRGDFWGVVENYEPVYVRPAIWVSK